MLIAPLQPRELKIEITDSCNLHCTYCYLGEKIGKGTRFMAEDEVLRWIDWTADNGIKGIRFTGGEATLHPQIEMFCYYAHLRGLYIILNTNGMGDHALYDRLFGVVKDVRVSLPTLDADRLDDITGGKEVLARKRDTIERALRSKVHYVCLLTPLLPELHGKMEDFIHFTATSPRFLWLPLRYESTPALPRPWTRNDAQEFAEEMADLMDRYPKQAKGIFLAMPFCGIKPTHLGARVFRGRTLDCGPFAALNVSAAGRMQACFDICEMDYTGPLAGIEHHPEIRACASNDALPAECRRCGHVTRCAGGCRKPYGLVPYGDKCIDYLAGFL